MTDRRLGDRLAPIVAGAAGLGWFWMELAPECERIPDPADPAVGHTFLAAPPGQGASL